MSHFREVFAAALLASLVPACVAETPLGVAESEVRGGTADLRFPGVGYLGTLTEGDVKNFCVATLIDRRLAITAAHCGQFVEAGSAVFGTGILEDKNYVKVKAFYAHPNYRFDNKSGGVVNDIAVVTLEDDPQIEGNIVAPVATSEPLNDTTDGAYTYVGYGRSQRGGPDAPDPELGKRKSISLSMTEIGAEKVYATAVDGATCSNDSGGPLLSSSGKLVAILNGFARLPTDCALNSDVRFTQVEKFKGFIDSAKACALPAEAVKVGGDPGFALPRTCFDPGADPEFMSDERPLISE